VFHSPVNRSWQKYSVRHGDGAGNDDTRCPENFWRNVRRQPAVKGLGDEGPGSARPVDRRSNTGHTDFWRLQALRGRWWRRRFVSGWSGSGPRQPNVSSPTWTTNSSSTPHTQYSRLADRRCRLWSLTVMTCPPTRSTQIITRCN